MVWVSAYSTYRGVFASTILMSKLLTEFAIVAWAGGEIFLRLVLFPKDRYSISQEALDLCSVLHYYYT